MEINIKDLLVYVVIPLISVLGGFVWKTLNKKIDDLEQELKEERNRLDKQKETCQEKREESIRRVHERIDTIGKTLADQEVTVAGFPAVFVSRTEWREECRAKHTTP